MGGHPQLRNTVWVGGDNLDNSKQSQANTVFIAKLVIIQNVFGGIIVYIYGKKFWHKFICECLKRDNVLVNCHSMSLQIYALLPWAELSLEECCMCVRNNGGSPTRETPWRTASRCSYLSKPNPPAIVP